MPLIYRRREVLLFSLKNEGGYFRTGGINNLPTVRQLVCMDPGRDFK